MSASPLASLLKNLNNLTPTNPIQSNASKTIEDRDDLIFELIKRRYDSEMDKIASLDNKSASLIGFVSVVVGLIVGGGSFKFSIIASELYLSVPYFFSVGSLLFSIFMGLRAFRNRNWLVAPNVVELLINKTQPNVSYSQVLQETGNVMVDAIIDATDKNRARADNINRSWIALIAGLLSVFIFLMIFVLSGAAVINDM